MVNIREFEFITFEEWKEQKFKWIDKLGDFYCSISLFEEGGFGSKGNTYVAAISVEERPTNIYSKCIYSVKSPFISTIYDEEGLKDWYNWVIEDIKYNWKLHILYNYILKDNK